MINFNGVDLSTIGKITSLKRNVLPPSQVTTVDIPARPGLLLRMKKHGARVIEVGMLLTGGTKEELVQKAEDLAFILDTDDVAPVNIQDEPNREYFGICIDEIDKDDITYRHGNVKFNILCPDPYKYGPEITTNVPVANKVTVTNPGTVETFPLIDIVVKNPVTFISAISPDNAVVLGRPASPSKSTVDLKPKILTDEMSSLTNWAASATPVDGGTIAGTMGLTSYGFQPSSYGTGVNTWHGPSVKRSLSKQIQDFEVKFWIWMNSQDKTIGRTELYLLDVNGGVLGKLAMADNYYSNNWVVPEIRAGSQYLVKEGDARPTMYSSFYGELTLRRKGNRWFATIAMPNPSTGVLNYNVIHGDWVDSENKVTGKLASVAVHMGAWNATTPTPMEARHIEVVELLDESDVQVPFIAQAGDKVTIDCASGNILVNDYPRQDLYNPMTDWVSIPPGTVDLAFIPADDLTVTMKHRGRWK